MKLFIIVLVLAIEAIVAPEPYSPLKQMKSIPVRPLRGKMVDADAEPPLNRYIKQKKHRTARTASWTNVRILTSGLK